MLLAPATLVRAVPNLHMRNALVVGHRMDSGRATLSMRMDSLRVASLHITAVSVVANLAT